MEVFDYCRKKKAKEDIEVNAILKGNFKRGEIVNSPIRREKTRYHRLYYQRLKGIIAIPGFIRTYTNWCGTGKTMWVYLGTKYEVKDYEEDEHRYYAIIPKGTTYIKVRNDLYVCETVVVERRR